MQKFGVINYFVVKVSSFDEIFNETVLKQFESQFFFNAVVTSLSLSKNYLISITAHNDAGTSSPTEFSFNETMCPSTG